jgi:glucose-1-phosphate thymidylyltransferase
MRFVGLLVVDDPGAPTGPRHIGRPHALELVANQPIAHHVLDALRAAGARELVVACSSAHADAVRECLAPKASVEGLALKYLHRSGPLDVTAALQLAAAGINGAPCLLHMANGLIAEPLWPRCALFESGRAEVAVLAPRGTAPTGGDSHERSQSADGHPDANPDQVAGVWMFGPGALTRLARAGCPLEPTAVARSTDGRGLQLLRASEWVQYAGDPSQLLSLNRVALDRLEPAPERQQSGENRVEGRVEIDAQATVRNSVILGPVVIGPRARIVDAYIGPYTSVGAGAHIEGAEIERSIIAERASVMHIGGRIVASVVGREARVFRDFSLPKALRLRLAEGTEVALC